MRRALVGAVVIGALSATPAHAATAFDVGAGSYPDVVTDENGNAHVAWLAGNVVRYCRIPKGATACAATASITPPGNATAGRQIAIVNAGNSIIQIVNHRTTSPPANSGAYMMTSGSNGNSFGAPVLVGVNELSGGAVPGPGTGVSTVTEQGGSINYQRMPFPAISNPTVASFPGGSPSEAPSVALLPSGRPLVAWDHGVANDIVYRKYKASAPAPSGNGPPPPANVVGNWDPDAPAVQGRFPHVASGPNGLVLLYEAKSDFSLRAVRLNTATETFTPPEGPQTITPGTISESDLSANRTSGHFHSVWRAPGANGTEIRYSKSDAGTSWSAPVPILRGVPSTPHLQVSGAPDDSGWIAFENGTNINVAPLEAIVDPPPGGGTPTPNPGSGTPNPGSGNPNPGTGTAPSNPIPGGQVTVGNEVIQLFGPTTCVVPGQKVKLRVTSKRKKKLAGNKGRSKITLATFYVDKVKKKDKKKAFQQSFKTDGFALGSKHKLGANLKLKQLSGKKKSYGKKLKGTFTMCVN
jgi:hypothetical protein